MYYYGIYGILYGILYTLYIKICLFTNDNIYIN